MSNLLTRSNCYNIGTKWACLCMFLCVGAMISVQDMRVNLSRKRMIFSPDVHHVFFFLRVFASLVKGNPCQMIKDRYDASYLEFELQFATKSHNQSSWNVLMTTAIRQLSLQMHMQAILSIINLVIKTVPIIEGTNRSYKTFSMLQKSSSKRNICSALSCNDDPPPFFQIYSCSGLHLY